MSFRNKIKIYEDFIRDFLPTAACCGVANCINAESFLLNKIFTRCTSP
jgi:hypothetical protein